MSENKRNKVNGIMNYRRGVINCLINFVYRLLDQFLGVMSLGGKISSHFERCEEVNVLESLIADKSYLFVIFEI